MTEKVRNLLVRTATGAAFVAVVLGAILLGRASYFVLLTVIAGGCIWEFFALARKGGLRTPLKWLGSAYIAVSLGLMAFFPPRFAVAFVLTVWANDVFAYLTGITLGRGGKHKMCETISPRKTWEGFAGGLAGAVMVSAAIGRFWFDADVWLWAAAFGLCIALGAVAGDLAESRLKRRAGVKDSGNVLHGRGGLLDRCDAMLGAAPVAFLLYMPHYIF